MASTWAISDTAGPAAEPVCKTPVAIASTMRSGSTLLKALLAEADDVSNLPEINFQRYRTREKIARLDEHPIVVMKRPAWYHEIFSYPRLPDLRGLKVIVLVRDAYETVVSLRKMSLRGVVPLTAPLVNRFLVDQYWARVNERLAAVADELDAEDVRLVRYEDLLEDPVTVTRELFRFIGSAQDSGVDSYRKPTGFRWEWGQDDGGDRIKSLCVQPPRQRPHDDRALLETIERSARARAVRIRLGYAAPAAD